MPSLNFELFQFFRVQTDIPNPHKNQLIESHANRYIAKTISSDINEIPMDTDVGHTAKQVIFKELIQVYFFKITRK